MRNRYPVTSWADNRVEIRKSAISGTGIFTKKPIKKDETVIAWGGKLVASTELKTGDINERAVPVEIRKNVMYYLRSTDEEELHPHPANFINHSCDPNAWLINSNTFIARRDIGKDEEITCDYATFTVDTWKMSCICGSPQCRKIITGNDWKNRIIQRKYRNHFSPAINRLITRV